jgi:hypothetical protein
MDKYGGSFDMPRAFLERRGDGNGLEQPAGATAAPMDGFLGIDVMASGQGGGQGEAREDIGVGSHASSSSSAKIKTAMEPSSPGNDSTMRSDYFLPSSWNTAPEEVPFESRTCSERSSEEYGQGKGFAAVAGGIGAGAVRRHGSDLALFDLQGDDSGGDGKGAVAAGDDDEVQAMDRMDSEKLTAELASAAALFSRCGNVEGQKAGAGVAAGGSPAIGGSWAGLGRGQSGGLGDDYGVGSFGMRHILGGEAASSRMSYERDAVCGVGMDQYRSGYAKGRDEPVVGYRQPFGATAASMEAAKAKRAAEGEKIFVDSESMGPFGVDGEGMEVDEGEGAVQQQQQQQQSLQQQQQERKAGAYVLRYGMDQQGRVVFGGDHPCAEAR